MRFAVVLASLLAVSAAAPDGCGKGRSAADPCDAAAGSCTPHPDCVGKACGESCNPCGPERVCPTFVASACDRFGQCVGDTGWICYDPCAGKACGDGCRLCPPGAAGCVETMDVKACDTGGRCVSQTPDLVCP